jgi:2-dehydro-3-deoxygluconokinase
VTGAVLAAVGEGLAELTLAPDGDTLAVAPGGDAANVLVMAARLGTPTRLGGRVGADPFGQRLTRFWEQQGIDVSMVRADSAAPTGLYLNAPAADGGHAFTYWRTASAGSRLQPTDLPAAFFASVACLVVTGVTLAVLPAATAHAVARAPRVACVLNHRPALGGDPAALAALARRSDIVIGARAEADALDLYDTAGELVLTDGPRPATVATPDGSFAVAPPDVPVRNAAGAGDALAGAYLSARLHDRPPAGALAVGVAAAALSVQRDGCAASYPTVDETLALARTLPEAVAA